MLRIRQTPICVVTLSRGQGIDFDNEDLDIDVNTVVSKDVEYILKYGAVFYRSENWKYGKPRKRLLNA